MTEAIDVANFERITQYLTQTGIVPEYVHNTTDSGDSSHWHNDRSRERQCWSVADCDNDHLEFDEYIAIRDTTDHFLYGLSQSNGTVMLETARLIVQTHEEQRIQHRTQREGECERVWDFRDYACVYRDVDTVNVTTTTSQHLTLKGVQYSAGQQKLFSIELYHDSDSKVVRIEGDQMVFAAILHMIG